MMLYQVGYEWSDRNKEWCGFGEYPFEENETYYLGDHYSIVGVRNYAGLYDNFSPEFHELIGSDDHGRIIGNVYESLSDDPDMSEIEKENIHDEMSTYIHTFFDGWTVTVRAIS